MPPTIHSEYAPSSLADMILCLGRMAANKGRDGGSSPAAERGTECHDWGEKLFPAEIDGLDCPVPDFVEDWQEGCTRDMVKHATDVFDKYTLIGDVKFHLEVPVNLGHFHNSDPFELTEVFGTLDVLMYDSETKTMIVLDYKSGIGIEVFPEKNVQLMVYALGAMEKYPDVETIEICISQPRIHSELRTWTITRKELLDWCTDTLIPALIGMSKPNAPKTPGEKQCRWCAIAGTCDVQRREMLQMLDENPEPANTADDTVLSYLLSRLKEFRLWTNQVEGAAMGIMESGKPLAGFKLVRGRGSRAWFDEETAEKFLRNQKLKEKERYTYKLLTPPQAEKVLKAKLTKTVTKNRFYSLIDKKEGKITYAPENDKREAVIINKTEGLLDLDDLL